MIEIGDTVEIKSSGVLGEVTDITDKYYSDEREIWARWDDTKEVLWMKESDLTLCHKGGN